jgi:cellulose synthase/poly-beta-1,6-N-acetylglucosamine synthase-like glycosyltransferase
VMDWLNWADAARTAYFVVLGLLCVYGLHRCFLVYVFSRVRNSPRLPAGHFDELPAVTVQLPMYNEPEVARRVILHAGALDYPRDRLQIQVLDDSTDETREIARAAVAELQAQGIDAEYLHRTERTGFKAGALEAGLKSAKGEFVAIFDADFIPPPTILKETVHYFTDPRVGMVQTRWDHLNRDVSLLTQAQAILLDGHFIIEHTARNRTGRFMSFNGTAGVWRKAAIQEAGGWQHDTLTEDLDLSYRAQLAGWEFVFRPEITSPAELPPEMNAFKAQQHRWTKGGAQTCKKLLPLVMSKATSWRVKLEAFFHLTSCVVYVLMVALTLLLGPTLLANMSRPISAWWMLPVEMLLFTVGFGSATLFYVASQVELRRGFWGALRYVPALMAVGVGIAFNNAIATIEGFFGKTGEFVRTPKFGAATNLVPGQAPQKRMGMKSRNRWQAWAELAIAAYLTAWLVALIGVDGWVQRISLAIPFVAIFILGYTYVAFRTLAPNWRLGR